MAYPLTQGRDPMSANRAEGGRSGEVGATSEAKSEIAVIEAKSESTIAKEAKSEAKSEIKVQSEGKSENTIPWDAREWIMQLRKIREDQSAEHGAKGKGQTEEEELEGIDMQLRECTADNEFEIWTRPEGPFWPQ